MVVRPTARDGIAATVIDYLFGGDLASIASATPGLAPMVTVTFIPVARSLNFPGRPFTVILVVGRTRYSLEDWLAKTWMVIDARWTAVIVSFVFIGTGVAAFFRPLADRVTGEIHMNAADKMKAAMMDVFFMRELGVKPEILKTPVKIQSRSFLGRPRVC